MDPQLTPKQSEVCKRLIKRLKEYDNMPNIDAVKESIAEEVKEELGICDKLGLMED